MRKILNQNLITQNGQIISRPATVVLLGHVDHGKTTLLDAIAGSQFAAREFGEITQSIRALEIKTKHGPITFIDTPGHSFFANLRSKGAKFADIALLVVSAAEGVREQTIEAIKLIEEAKIPVICVITKIDLPKADSDTIKKQLTKAGFATEGEGGQIPLIEVSAVKKTGIENLLETISIVATLADLKANLQAPVKAIVLESYLDKNAGPLCLILVIDGILKIGSSISVDGILGKIRAIFDSDGRPILAAFPSQPVKILGLPKVVSAGAKLTTDGFSKISPNFQVQAKGLTLTDRDQIKKQFKIILKADSIGSKEAILANLPKDVTVLDTGVGQVTAADIEKAVTFSGKVFGFNVGLTQDGAKLLKGKKDMFFSSKLIYELIDEVKRQVETFGKTTEKVLGMAKIVASFDVGGQKIAGCKVLEGFLATGSAVKLLRGEKEVGKGEISSMKQYAKTVTNVKAGGECGIGFAPPIDFEVGDVLQFVA